VPVGLNIGLKVHYCGAARRGFIRQGEEQKEGAEISERRFGRDLLKRLLANQLIGFVRDIFVIAQYPAAVMFDDCPTLHYRKITLRSE
jgi:hypothetical protein